nr:hypothetical protein CFP56_60027 [Quercus suber]
MTTRFSKQKLVEAKIRRPRAASSVVLSPRKRQVTISKKDPVVTPLPTHSPTKRPTSSTSSLEDDTDAIALKAHEVLSLDDLSPLMAKSSSKVLGESLFISRKLLDLEKKVAMFEPVIKSLSGENEMFKNKVVILIVEA